MKSQRCCLQSSRPNPAALVNTTNNTGRNQPLANSDKWRCGTKRLFFLQTENTGKLEACGRSSNVKVGCIMGEAGKLGVFPIIPNKINRESITFKNTELS